MKIGKYVKTFIKKFYFRLSAMEEILNTKDLNKFVEFVSNLNIIKKDQITRATKEMININLKIQSSIENNSKLDNF